MDMSSIQAAIGGLKTASDIAKAMVDIRDAAVLQSKTIELQQVILSAQSSGIAAQSEQFTLLERIRNLEEKMAHMETWNTEKERYALCEVVSGAFTYVLKEVEGAVEPTHHLCANCYDQGQKSIMHKQKRDPGRAEYLTCHNCEADILIRGVARPEHRPRVITKKPR